MHTHSLPHRLSAAIAAVVPASLLTLALGLTDSALAIEPPPPEAGIDWRAPDGSTALQWAVYDGAVERVEQLLKAGADPMQANNYGANPMQLAAEVANTDILERLLKAGANADSPNPEGQTALMLVARTGNVAAAQLLIKSGATVDAREGWGDQTALMWATARRHPAMMELLLESGADPNAQSRDRDYRRHLTKEGRAKSLDAGGMTPLLYAVRENCLACIDVLVKRSADLNQPDPEGVAPLLLATLNSHWDAALRLIKAGADVQQWDNYGQTALHAALGRRSSNPQNPLDGLNETDGLAVVRLLLERGANPNIQLFLRPSKQRGAMSRGTTPLIIAASSGDVDTIQLLLDHGADATLLQADRQSPIIALAGARGAPDRLLAALNLLIAAGADPNVVSVHHHLQRTRGGSALHAAVRANNARMVEALVAAGADINIKDYDGVTPLDYAMARGHVGFLQMRQPPNTKMADQLRMLGATEELPGTPFWPNVGPPFFYPWSIFPLDPAAEATALVPGSFDHQ